MKIRLFSDLHLEGYSYYYEYAGEDILVLAGDIHTDNRHRFILDQIPSNVKVLLVAGNHEYYSNTFESVNQFFYNLQADYTNFYWLNNESIIIDGVHFYGGTMFTDWELYGDSWTAKQFGKNSVADFQWVSKIGRDGIKRMWNTDDHLQEHLAFRDSLVRWLNKPAEKRVVVSHFVPHPNGSHEKYKGSAVNPYFLCDMRKYMDNINIWIYGHTHTSKDFMEGNCRLVCNPRGYGAENVNDFNKDLIVEI
jgi:predicted phosphodiesterase